MVDRFDAERAGEDEGTDPRLDQYTRYHPGEDERGGVLLIGVAHDHPASVARVAHLLDADEPDVLALELPPLAVPLFRSYAGDEYVPPRLGGEMSAAIQAAVDARTVGIDGPNATYLKLLLRRLITERLPVRDLPDVGRDLLRGVGQALACRLGAAVARLTPFTPKVYAHIAYDIASFDTPFAQAEHERNHVTERQSFLRVVELPRVVTLIDAVREESMANQLTELRATDDVVAVVGIEHLDELSERLDDEPETGTESESDPISAV